MMRKPRFTVAEWLTVEPFLLEIREYLMTYNLREDADWPSAASDVLDGWANDEEVRPLVRKRIITIIRDHACEEPACANCRTLSRCHTWHLTKRGLRLLWPDAARPRTVYGE
jgi:hypothetical protein